MHKLRLRSKSLIGGGNSSKDDSNNAGGAGPSSSSSSNNGKGKGKAKERTLKSSIRHVGADSTLESDRPPMPSSSKSSRLTLGSDPADFRTSLILVRVKLQTGESRTMAEMGIHLVHSPN